MDPNISSLKPESCVLYPLALYRKTFDLEKAREMMITEESTKQDFNQEMMKTRIKFRKRKVRAKTRSGNRSTVPPEMAKIANKSKVQMFKK